MKWLLLLAACGHVDRGPDFRAAGNALREGGTLHVALKDQVRTLDPTIEYDEMSHYAVHALFDAMLDYEPAGTRLVPRLAERWEVSSDGLRYTFWLRDGVVYSDGTPVVTSDIAYSLERAKNTADSPFGPFLADVAEVTTPNARELDIRLARPNAAFAYVMAMPFTTPQRADHVTRAGDQLRREPLGCGPFVVERWDEGQRLVLRRNPRYFDLARIHLDAIEFRENIPRDTQFLMFERGELDAVDRLAPPDYLWVIAQPEWQPYVYRVQQMNAYGARMNVRVKPFDDRRVRQALNYALDKQHAIKLLQGAAVAAHGILPPGIAGRDDALPPYPHDPARAKALLAEAGYPNGFDVDYAIINDDEAERLAGSLQADLAAVGVRVHLVEMAYGTYATALTADDGPPFAQVGWVADYADPGSFFDPSLHSRAIGGTNYSFYANPELDELLDAARGEPDPAKRDAAYRSAERIVREDAPWIWSYHQLTTEVVQPYVKSYAPHPIWARDYTAAWLDLGADGERLRR
jgi:ABC-type transport system substrate-binding protein